MGDFLFWSSLKSTLEKIHRADTLYTIVHSDVNPLDPKTLRTEDVFKLQTSRDPKTGKLTRIGIVIEYAADSKFLGSRDIHQLATDFGGGEHIRVSLSYLDGWRSNNLFDIGIFRGKFRDNILNTSKALYEFRDILGQVFTHLNVRYSLHKDTLCIAENQDDLTLSPSTIVCAYESMMATSHLPSLSNGSTTRSFHVFNHYWVDGRIARNLHLDIDHSSDNGSITDDEVGLLEATLLRNSVNLTNKSLRYRSENQVFE